MNKNEFSNIQIPLNIDDSIDKGIERALREIKRKKHKKMKIIIGTIVACLVMILTFGIVNPALASSIPFIGSAFEAIEKNIIFPGDYSQYATSVNETVSDKDVKITLSDILCDGEGLYVTYIVESEKPFKYTSWGDSPLTMNQLLTKEAYNKVSFSDKELDNTGFAGLEGGFIDDKTFIGMERYYLNSLKTDIPDEFDFQVKLKSIGTGALKEGEKDQNFKGTWAFKVPVKVDKTISKNIDLNYEYNGFSLDSMLITPIQTIIKTTNPTNSSYGIIIVDDKNNELKNYSGKIDNNHQTSYFSSLDKDIKSVKIIIYRDKLIKKETIKHHDGSIETNYDNLGQEVLLERTVDIK
ncbi:DUF4179 domain-containing protein [Clostridium frigidicarnis]|uniref:DUF4179 domain-containing protein n=1 Tax=Clostridium frigidicarnis TaxID=84698 RepID=A0A1I0ZJR4_9CLOT|nr:DUF4179 domain-containing protein [Clostridium frigidicarnis]SFB26009.1 protein of unknown function [Clostridium frigidicarnis]